MGLISFIKSFFNKDLECKEDISNHFVFMFPLVNLIKVDRFITVPNGFEAVFVANDTVCDVLHEGKHRITNASLPVLFNKLKLNRANKKGKTPSKFKCDIYFVNLSDISTNFIGQNPFVLKSHSFGKVKGFTEGMIDFRVVDSAKLIEFLLMDMPYIKNGKAIEMLSVCAGDEINSILEKGDTNFKDIIMHPNAIHKYLEQEMVDKLDYMGVRVLDAEVTALRLNKKVQEKVNKYLSNQSEFEEQFEEFSTGKVKVEAGTKKENELVDSETMIDNGSKVQELDSYFVNDLKTTTTTKDKAKEILFNTSHPSTLFKNKGNVRTQAKVENDFNSTPTLKQCKFCGATIDVNASFCPKCGFRQDF